MGVQNIWDQNSWRRPKFRSSSPDLIISPTIDESNNLLQEHLSSIYLSTKKIFCVDLYNQICVGKNLFVIILWKYLRGSGIHSIRSAAWSFSTRQVFFFTRSTTTIWKPLQNSNIVDILQTIHKNNCEHEQRTNFHYNQWKPRIVESLLLKTI